MTTYLDRELHTKPDVPSGLVFDAQEWIRRLGLSEWTITLAMADEPSEDQDGNVGRCQYDVRYQRARITIRRDLSLRDQQGALRHELLHLATAEVDHLVASMILPAVPRRLRKVLTTLYDDASELTIERLAHAFAAPPSE